MGFARITNGQLEFLSSSRFRPEQFTRFARNPSTGEIERVFESLEACQAEDRLRAAALRALAQPPKKRRNRATEAPAIPGDPLALAAVLETIADTTSNQPIRSCLASAVYTRYRRIGVLGAIVELLANSRGLNAAWLSCSSTHFRFDPNHGWPEVAQLARQHLEHKLRPVAALDAPGFLIGFFHGCYLPDLERFQLRYRGIIAGGKLSCVRQQKPMLVDSKSPVGDIRIRLHPIKDLRQQVSELLPNFLPEVPRSCDGKSGALSRMRESAHNMYLLWLSQHCLADMAAILGTFYWDGQLKMTDCVSTRQVSGRSTDRAAQTWPPRSPTPPKHHVQPNITQALPGI